MNKYNEPMWNKVVKEVQKVEKYITPTQKLRYLVNCIEMTNNTFALFTSDKED